ncbi:MAG: DNA polymerase III subunit alpha [Spirochaetia bacterium]|nr:DNA polymerase III subunit alpha [Spirochaetia bacterium]
MSSAGSFPEKFTHLHLHTVYSLLDGAIRVKDLMKHVKEMGMDSVAMTDHGNMFGAVDFYDAARAEGIKPIIGQEFYIAPGSRFDKRNAEGVADGQAYHLVLLAKNQKGYKNLIKLSSRGYLEGFYRKPRIDYDLLTEFSEGLIATSACLAGEINRKIVQNKMDEALLLSGHLNEIMGKGNFYLEIQNHGLTDQKTAAKGSVEIHKKTGIPLVLTNDAHFLRQEDHQAQDIMLRIQMNKKLDEPLDFGFNNEFYVKSPAEMFGLFPEFPDAFHNTRVISDQIDFSMDFGRALLPDFKTPAGFSLKQYLEKLVNDGLHARFSSGIPDEYKKRAEYELSVVGQMGFEGYFLIVADFINYAKKSRIPVGPGRGSAAGSIIAYALGITAIDPLKYDLLFERFLNPSRKEMPDIDIDFCRDRREEVINYVIDKYGADHVAQIITFGSLSARAVIKDVARVMGFDYAEVNAMCKNLPDTPGISLKDAVENSSEAKAFFKTGEKEKTLWRVALTLEGIPRNAGKHAAGVVITPEPLDEIIPVAKDTKTGAVISQFDKNPLEKVGLVKMDFLGLKNLTIIQRALDVIKERKGIDIDINNIPLDDPKPYELLQKGKTKGIFQLENTGMTRLLIRSRPKRFEDIIACIALYRPGPLESGMTEDYVRRKNGEEAVSYPHESLKGILEDTYGTMVYQEQVMLISQIIAGFTMAEADELRKAMGKKKMDVMDKLKNKFVDQAVGRGHKAPWAGKLFDSMAEFGKYGFNKSHSAAYGMITYQTAWLKAHYPTEFLKATLDSDIETTEKLISFIHEARQMEISILPPDINESNEYFTIIDDKTIRYGLLGLKGVGRAAVESVLIARKKKTFASILDFTSRVHYHQLNKKLLEALVCSGAFDSMGYTRSSLYDQMENILSHGNSLQRDKEAGQSSLFESGETQPAAFHLPQLAEWEENKKLQLEKTTLGLYLTSHPLNKFIQILSETTITPLEDADDGINTERQLTFIGVIEESKSMTTKRGRNYIRMIISDLSDRMEVRIFEPLASEARPLLIENQIIILDTKVTIARDTDSPNIQVIANKIYSIETLMERVKKSLHLFLGEQGNDIIKKKIQDIKKILFQNKGQYPVFLHYKNHENKVEVVKAHSMFSVSYSENLTRALQPLLNSENHIAWRVAGQIQVADKSFKLG